MEDYMKKLIIVWLALFALTSTANAGFLFEPYFGYDFSMSGEIETSPEVRKAKWSTFEVGGRIGWIFNWIGIGLDFDWKKPEVTWEANAANAEAKTDVSMTNLAGFIGLYLGKRGQWMIRLKYNFMSNAKSDFNTGGNAATWEYKGMGYGIDLGYRFLNWLALNIDYTMNTYDELSGNSNVPKFKTSDLLVSISLPFEFPSRGSR